MSRRFLSIVLLLLLANGCGSDQLIGQRYQAERALWNANREMRRLSIRPSLVTEEQWYAAAARYQDIVAQFGSVPVRPDSTEAGDASRDIHVIVARALLSAAQVHAAVRDSTTMMALFEQVAEEYADVPRVAAEVALAQGGIAEGKANWDEAIQAYQRVLDNATPTPGEAGVGGVVMELPIRMARIQARGAGAPGEQRAPYYAEALLYYEEMIETHPDSRVEIEARGQLARIATDLQDWDTAIRELQTLEQELLTFRPRPRDPGEVRFAIAVTQSQDPSRTGETEGTLNSLLDDYPDSPFAPRALLALANGAATQGDVEGALEYLDRIRDDYADNESEAAQGMLTRGRIFEANDRWPEALEVFRALPVQHPISEPALLAPLDVVAHYQRAGDEGGTKEALGRAERSYREFITRYPQGRASFSAREKLARTLALQERYADAVTEMVNLGEILVNTRQGASLMINAAKMAYVDLGDTTRAAEILERVGTLYAKAELGRWATGEAARLREEMPN